MVSLLSTKRNCAMLAMVSALLLSGSAAFAQPVPVIFDTDMGNDIDDALALAMLHAFQSRGEVELLAVTVTKDNVWAGRFVSAVNSFYGRGNIPTGVVKNGKTPEEGNYNRRAIEAGRFSYQEPAHEAVALLRRTLASQRDGSVVLIQVGFSTNLARLLESDRELIAKKVKFLSIMAGDFSGSRPEYNVKVDIAAAQKLARDWPTTVVWSGFEVGSTIKYPARSILNDFSWAPKHPVVEGYKAYMKMPYDRETWDLTSVLYAVRPEQGYFNLSSAGTVVIDEKGVTTFAAGPDGRHRHLVVDDAQRMRVLESFLWLATQPRR